MRLNKQEILLVANYLRGHVPAPNKQLLSRVELGVWVFRPLQLGLVHDLASTQPLVSLETPHPIFISGAFGASATLTLIDAFKMGALPYLLVRSASWEVYLLCNGEILTEHCNEDLDSIREACERVRRRCRNTAPSVAI